MGHAHTCLISSFPKWSTLDEYRSIVSISQTSVFYPHTKAVHTQRRPTLWTREPCTSQVVCKLIGSNPSVHLQKLNLYGRTSRVDVKTVNMIRIKIFPGKLLPFLPPFQQTKTFIIILEYDNLANNKMTYVFFLLGVPHWFPGLAERLGVLGLLVFCFIFFN